MIAVAELRKLPAFVRRDFLVFMSYRMAFVTDLIFIGAQALLFSFLARIVDPGRLPDYGAGAVGYLEFVMIGVVVSAVATLLLQSVATAIRNEQMIGTLEALLTSPTSPVTIQAGSIAFDALFVPIRMAVLLVATAIVFGLHLDAGGILPAMVVFAAFVPFVWGLGLVGAGGTLTFRRGGRDRGGVDDGARAAVGRLLPARAAAAVAADAGRRQPARDRAGRHPGSADRRGGVVRDPRRRPGARPAVGRRHARRRRGVPRRAGARAAQRDPGALLRSDVIREGDPYRLRADGVHWRRIDGEVVALNGRRSTYVAANPAGSLLWQALADGATRSELADRLVRAFGIDRGRAAADVDTYLAQLRAEDLLEP